jgi:hypothetical protein
MTVDYFLLTNSETPTRVIAFESHQLQGNNPLIWLTSALKVPVA